MLWRGTKDLCVAAAAAAATMATPVGPAHHAACPQAFHSYHVQPQQHPHPWPEQSFVMHPAPHTHSPIDEINPAKLGQPHRYSYRGDWPAAMRQQQQQHAQSSGYHGYPTTTADGQTCLHHATSGANELPLPSAPPFPYISTATSSTSKPLTIPSPPLSDGSPRAEWAAFVKAEAEQKQTEGGAIPFNRNSPVLRSDGVRKKNAKFEIPAERNLETLDDMIKGAKTDTERKEFKMQKRLLRNREAALHSRQKKKNHTEQLERDNARLASKIGQMQHHITALEIQVDDHGNERESLQQQISAAEERARQVEEEKAGLARERAQMMAELEQLRTQLRGPAASRSPAGIGQTEASLGTGNGGAFPVDAWHEPGFDMMSELYLAPEKLQGRPDDSKSSVVVH